VVPKLWTETIETHRSQVREAILHVTARLVAEQGPASVTMSQVADGAGIGRATLYKYFSDVEAILTAWHADQIAVHMRQLTAVANLTTDPASQLDALISDIETTLVNAGHVQVISLESQPQLMEQVRRQYQDGFDQSKIAGWGKQIGVRYVVTGKVFSNDERQDKERRVQYFMFIQVLDVETSAILFQYKTSVTKALI